MNRRLLRLLILSAILPATYLLILTLIFIPNFITTDLSGQLIVCSFLLGIGGYVGLWRNLLDKKYKRSYLNKVFLIAGLIGGISFLLITGSSMHLSVGLLIFLWPIIVSIIILTHLFKTSQELQA